MAVGGGDGDGGVALLEVVVEEEGWLGVDLVWIGG